MARNCDFFLGCFQHCFTCHEGFVFFVLRNITNDCFRESWRVDEPAWALVAPRQIALRILRAASLRWSAFLCFIFLFMILILCFIFLIFVIRICMFHFHDLMTWLQFFKTADLQHQCHHHHNCSLQFQFSLFPRSEWEQGTISSLPDMAIWTNSEWATNCIRIKNMNCENIRKENSSFV